MSGGPFYFRVHFEVENLSLSRDDDNYLTSCEGGVIPAYPAPLLRFPLLCRVT